MHPDGVSALMYAAAGGHPEVVAFLLGGEGVAKADPNLKHVQGGTALMEAATSESQVVVDLLLAAGADPMVRDKDGVSPLMSAAAQVKINIWKFGSKSIFFLGGLSLIFHVQSVSVDLKKVLCRASQDLDTERETTICRRPYPGLSVDHFHLLCKS